MHLEPIRVLNLFSIMNRGGAETMVMNYYRNIDRSKVQFDFMVHREERGAYDDQIESLGGRIYRMCPIYPQNFRIYKKKLKDFFSEHKEYKIIHGHMSELGVFAYEEAERAGVPIRICHAHNAPNGFDMKTLFREYFKYKSKKYITHRFICGQEAGKWLFGKENKEKFILMNNAIDSKQFIYNEQISTKVKKELDIEGKFVIGHIGRFNIQKNHEFLIDIFSEIYKHNKNSVLLLAGTGELQKKIKEKVINLELKDKVRFLGVRTDVPQLLQAFNVFLFPSLFEGLPVTMVEAQAAGIKCFISDNIPKEVILTDLVEVISLKKSKNYWAEQVLKVKSNLEKRNMYNDILKVNYDINKNAKWLSEFYLDEYNKCSQ